MTTGLALPVAGEDVCQGGGGRESATDSASDEELVGVPVSCKRGRKP